MNTKLSSRAETVVECAGHQRNLANLRERKRMMLINKGFELLRAKLPIACLSRKQSVNGDERRTKRCKLTKVDILRLTIEYIKQLTIMLHSTTLDSTLQLDIQTISDAHQLVLLPAIKKNGWQPTRQKSTSLRSQRIRQQHKVKKVLDERVGEKQELAVRYRCTASIDNSANQTYIRYLLSWSRHNKETYNPDQTEISSTSKSLKGIKLWLPDHE